MKQKDFLVEDLDANNYPSPLQFPDDFYSSASKRILFNNSIRDGENIQDQKIFSFEAAGPYQKIHFESSKINAGIVTCGGLCPGLNDVIRSVTYNCLDSYGVKTVYGFEKDEIAKRSFLELFAAEEGDSYASLLRTFTFLNKAKQFSKHGGELFVNIRISPIEHLGKQVLLVTTSDITQHLDIEQQLVQAGKMATLGEMATGVAHELNQPLSVIKTASNFFARKIKKNEKIDEETLLSLSKKIGKNVDRATSIIDHMREFGRKSDVTLERVQVNHVLRRAHEVLAQQLKLRGIEVICHIQEDLPEVMAEPIRLEQVFINLLVNARDAIEEKLKTIEDKDSEEKITLRTWADETTVTIEVTDTGTGIPESIIEKIFEPFFTTKKVGMGTGIGLSISYGIIQDCGGNIRVISPKGEGACFVITIPRTEIRNHERDDTHS